MNTGEFSLQARTGGFIFSVTSKPIGYYCLVLAMLNKVSDCCMHAIVFYVTG
jgi:enhancing lycopene biosynthesis protein 2